MDSLLISPHSVIREHEDESQSVESLASEATMDEFDDDELALLGAPWAKEGILWRRPAYEVGGKKTTSRRDWKQFFVVIQKGDLHLFTFGDGKGSSFGGGTVGGGNWLVSQGIVLS